MKTNRAGQRGNVAATGVRSSSTAKRLMILGVLLTGIAGLLLLPPASSAHPLLAVAQQPASNSVTIAPGGTVTFTARGFCLDFGRPFPDQKTTPRGLADDKVRAALNYSIQRRYTEGSPDQVELAIWFLRDNTWHDALHAIAQEIVTNSATSSTPAAMGNGISLSDAIAQGRLIITAGFVAQSTGHLYGDATIELKNTGTAEVNVFIPVGTVFTVSRAPGKYQDLVAYLLRVQSQTPPAELTQQPTPTTDPSSMAQAEPTLGPSTLPQTGIRTRSESIDNFAPYLLLAVGLLLCGAILTSRPRKSARRP